MDAVYYLSIIMLVVGLPLLSLFTLFALVKPVVTRTLFKRQWSRKRIATLGTLSVLIGVVGFSFIINAAMPANIRAEIVAQQKARADMKAEQLANKQALKKIKDEQEALASKPVLKIETAKIPIQFTSSEREDGTMPKGERKVTTAGVNGEKTETYEVTYVRDKQTAKKLVKTDVTVQPTNEVISIGTYVTPSPAQKATPAPTYGAPTPSQNTSSYYANCAEARATGAAPIYKGQPGYRSGLDRDHDGVACE